ncbi:saccharopine dehydrogenase [Puteibacter caeruleilacunae]|nr:saccharopine dehydrogenase [Puteibacter caeruleilacunae]
MKKVLIIGAGRSSTCLIGYMEEKAEIYDWRITVADRDGGMLRDKVSERSRVIILDIFDEDQLKMEIEEADLVISLLPARFHPIVARACVELSKSMVTASYESSEIRALEKEAKERRLLFLNEMGVDPGLDHMSAMRVINQIREQGHEMVEFESFTGGLIAPESDDNPWHYKFTWNPRNVVIAGQGGPAKFLQEGKYKYIPYNRLFRRTEMIEIEGYGRFEGYANRDSLSYLEKYGLEGVKTIYRGTLRRPGFCRAWNVFVQLGATDDTYLMPGVENMTHRDFINSFLYYNEHDSVELKLFHYLHIDQDSDVIEKLKWLGIFDKTKIGLKEATPAQVLEHILKKKWQLSTDDKDMIAMWHKFIYKDRDTGEIKEKTSSLIVLGDDKVNTAMAKTVGLPLAIAAKMILTEEIKLSGVYIPTSREIYEPVLKELEDYGILFLESE